MLWRLRAFPEIFEQDGRASRCARPRAWCTTAACHRSVR